MDKREMTSLLLQNHRDFIATLSALTDKDFERQPGSKWTAGQQLDHILKSVLPVSKAFNTPINVLESKFGLSETPSRSYDQLVDAYLLTLKNLKDFVLPERFTPSPLEATRRSVKTQDLLDAVNLLNHGIGQIEEKTLDTHTIFHPAMGKLTLREMIYFTMYHVTHHNKQVLDNLKTYPE